ncbi:MAG: hypothetical protein ACI9NQ_000847, partial [Paracoccaceae bacterium]
MKKSRIKNLRTLLPACLGVFLTFASAQAEQVIFTEIQYNAKSG